MLLGPVGFSLHYALGQGQAPRVSITLSVQSKRSKGSVTFQRASACAVFRAAHGWRPSSADATSHVPGVGASAMRRGP